MNEKFRTKRTRQKQKLGMSEYINYVGYSTLGRAVEMSGLTHPHTVLTMSTGLGSMKATYG